MSDELINNLVLSTQNSKLGEAVGNSYGNDPCLPKDKKQGISNGKKIYNNSNCL